MSNIESDDYKAPALGPPVMKPNLVQGYVMHQQHAQPTKYLYILEPNKNGEDRVWEWDAYLQRDEVNNRELWVVHITCPVCNNVLSINSEKKQIDIDKRGIETGEPIRCTWPGEFQAQCTWQCEIQRPNKDVWLNARDFSTGHPIKVRIDGIVRRI